jgi:Ca2+-dependent lipid-binding protein
MLFVSINRFFEKINWRGENDIYIIIKINDEVRRTTQKMNDNEPVWNERFLFDMFEDNGTGVLILEIWDYDKWGANNMIESHSVFIDNVGKHETYSIGPVSITIGDNDYTSNNDREKLLNQYSELSNKYNILNKEYGYVKEKMELIKQYSNEINNCL